jgi:hypothetical protein
MNEIEFVYFKKAPRGGAHVDNDHISISISKGKNGGRSSYRIRTNAKITASIIKKGCEFVCIGQNKLTGQKYLVFNHDKDNGYPIALPTEKNKDVIIYSKNIAEYVRNILSMKDDETRLWVSDDLSNIPDTVTIEIKRA